MYSLYNYRLQPSTNNAPDSYGYEISQTVKLVADIKESTLYPILKKLEKNGDLTNYTQIFQGRKRKYYSLTPVGNEHLQFLRHEWSKYRDSLDAIIETGNITIK